MSKNKNILYVLTAALATSSLAAGIAVADNEYYDYEAVSEQVVVEQPGVQIPQVVYEEETVMPANLWLPFRKKMTEFRRKIRMAVYSREVLAPAVPKIKTAVCSAENLATVAPKKMLWFRDLAISVKTVRPRW